MKNESFPPEMAPWLEELEMQIDVRWSAGNSVDEPGSSGDK